MQIPSYSYISEREWGERIATADALASSCMLCPRQCGARRFAGEKGYCGADDTLVISSVFPHHGEEPPISGTHGSGTVFFSNCSLQCCFCQNYQISQEGEGTAYSIEECAASLLSLQKQKVHNINFVTGSHYIPWILKALRLAAKQGLCLPLVWNSSGYETVQAMALLKGIVDIYLPDMKYGTNESPGTYCRAPQYVEINRLAVREMFRQAGPLAVDKNGIAYRGTCIRHLVLPFDKSGSNEVADFIARTFDPADITVSLMAQFRPMHKAGDYPELSRCITREEYAFVQELFENVGVNLFCQEQEALDESFCIDFSKRKTEPLTGI